MHNAAFAATGLAAHYELREIDADELPAFVAEARDPAWYGFQVTAPYKQAVMRLLDGLDDAATAIGAVNSVVREDGGSLVGFNTDAPGFAAAVRRTLAVDPAGTTTVVLGAGGAAHAVTAALLGADARRVTVANRDLARARRLAAQFDDARIEPIGLDDELLAGRLGTAALVVNATTVGMTSDGMPVPVEELGPATAIFDCVYVPRETDLVRAATARGLRASNGGEMLIAQAAIAFERWTGISDVDDVMRRAVQPLFDDPNARA